MPKFETTSSDTPPIATGVLTQVLNYSGQEQQPSQDAVSANIAMGASGKKSKVSLLVGNEQLNSKTAYGHMAQSAKVAFGGQDAVGVVATVDATISFGFDGLSMVDGTTPREIMLMVREEAPDMMQRGYDVAVQMFSDANPASPNRSPESVASGLAGMLTAVNESARANHPGTLATVVANAVYRSSAPNNFEGLGDVMLTSVWSGDCHNYLIVEDERGNYHFIQLVSGHEGAEPGEVTASLGMEDMKLLSVTNNISKLLRNGYRSAKVSTGSDCLATLLKFEGSAAEIYNIFKRYSSNIEIVNALTDLMQRYDIDDGSVSLQDIVDQYVPGTKAGEKNSLLQRLQRTILGPTGH
jgi:hypothetical protein